MQKKKSIFQSLVSQLFVSVCVCGLQRDDRKQAFFFFHESMSFQSQHFDV